MIEQVVSGLYRLEIPIPQSPLKATNAYLIKGKARNLLVDTGINRPRSLEVMKLLLAELDVEMENTDIFLTHMHADHSGLIPSLKDDASKIYASAADGEVVNRFLTCAAHWDTLYNAACRNGFSEEEASQAIRRHPGSGSVVSSPLHFTYVSAGTQIRVEDYLFTCIETPGHTKGHICLYDQEKEILLSGDHLLGDISPNITCWDDSNPLEDFLRSLKRIAGLPVKLVLPGHRRIFNNFEGRIKELLEHHRQRADEAYAILAAGRMTGYQVASHMTWDMVYDSWDDIAVPQKFFATGEALSHLRYLECRGLIKRGQIGEKTYYWR